jgi:hypothetical protein
MTMKTRLFAAAMGAVLTTALLLGPTSAPAQEDIRKKPVPSLELQDASIRDGLKLLFDSIGVQNYSIANDVQGNVTVKLTNVPLETALRAILDQVDATYSIEAGVIRIFRRERVTVPDRTTEGPSTQSSTVTKKIPVLHADPMLIAVLLEGKNTNFTLPPELSTLSGGFGGFGGGNGGFGNQGQGGGNFGRGGGNFGGGGGNFGGGGGNFGRGGGGGNFGGGGGGGNFGR